MEQFDSLETFRNILSKIHKGEYSLVGSTRETRYGDSDFSTDVETMKQRLIEISEQEIDFNSDYDFELEFKTISLVMENGIRIELEYQ